MVNFVHDALTETSKSFVRFTMNKLLSERSLEATKHYFEFRLVMLNETIKREGIHVCNKAELWYFMLSNLMNTFLTHIKT